MVGQNPHCTLDSPGKTVETVGNMQQHLVLGGCHCLQDECPTMVSEIVALSIAEDQEEARQ
jgi:hypothetical protein